MENKSSDFVLQVEQTDWCFNDKKADPKVPVSIVKTTIDKALKQTELFENKGKVEVLPQLTVRIGDNRYHYHAQYNSGKTTVPWYSISQSACSQINKDEIKGVVLIYVQTHAGNINGQIDKRYIQQINQDDIVTYGTSERRYLNFSYSEAEQTYVIEKGNNVLKMICVG